MNQFWEPLEDTENVLPSLIEKNVLEALRAAFNEEGTFLVMPTNEDGSDYGGLRIVYISFDMPEHMHVLDENGKCIKSSFSAAIDLEEALIDELNEYMEYQLSDEQRAESLAFVLKVEKIAGSIRARYEQLKRK